MYTDAPSGKFPTWSTPETFFASMSTFPRRCIFFILALWFWNHTWTTRTLSPVSLAKASRTYGKWYRYTVTLAGIEEDASIWDEFTEQQKLVGGRERTGWLYTDSMTDPLAGLISPGAGATCPGAGAIRPSTRVDFWQNKPSDFHPISARFYCCFLALVAVNSVEILKSCQSWHSSRRNIVRCSKMLGKSFVGNLVHTSRNQGAMAI